MALETIETKNKKFALSYIDKRKKEELSYPEC